MARLSTNLSLLATALLAAAALAACGGGGDADLLAGETAAEITQNLDRVEELANEGNCVGAEEATAEISVQVEELDVDSRLQAALSDGVIRLSEVVAGCEEDEEAPEVTETVEEPEEPEEEEPEKPGRERKEAEQERQPEAEPEKEGDTTTPPSAAEKGKSEEAPPAEPEAPSGGLGPGEPAGGE